MARQLSPVTPMTNSDARQNDHGPKTSQPIQSPGGGVAADDVKIRVSGLDFHYGSNKPFLASVFRS